MRLTIAENMVRAVSDAPHVTAVFEADFSAVAAHKAALAEARREAQLHRLHRQGRGRGDGGRAGDQRPLGKRPDRDLADDRHRRRHRARRKGPGRAGGEGCRIAQPRADRREARRSHPPRPRRQARPRRRLGRKLHHLQSRRVGLAARRADHPPPGAGGDPRHRQAREARGRARSRWRRRDRRSVRWPMSR